MRIDCMVMVLHQCWNYRAHQWKCSLSVCLPQTCIFVWTLVTQKDTWPNQGRAITNFPWCASNPPTWRFARCFFSILHCGWTSTSIDSPTIIQCIEWTRTNVIILQVKLQTLLVSNQNEAATYSPPHIFFQIFGFRKRTPYPNSGRRWGRVWKFLRTNKVPCGSVLGCWRLQDDCRAP